MTRTDQVLLQALRLSLRGEALAEDPALTAEEWEFLLRRAAEQEILPLILDTVYRCASLRELEEETRKKFRENALQIAMRQITQTNEFLNLVLHAQAQGLDPLVLKGITVRSLYPKPMLRPSVDEDILVSPTEVEAWHAFLLSEGLEPDKPDADLHSADELSYHKPNSPTYIEMHLSLFPPDSDAYGDCNALFENVHEQAFSIPVEDVTLRAMEPTEHLLYLICHAYKHFLHSGVGIRQVCDIGMFMERYADQILWERILGGCKSIHIEYFASAIFAITEKYLGFTCTCAAIFPHADESELLEDMLSGGLYGSVDINRLHSSNLTLDAVASAKKGKRASGVLGSVFLPLKSMREKFPYLKKFPVLLPLAWAQRVVIYILHRDKQDTSDPTESIRIGNERIALLKKYKILD